MAIETTCCFTGHRNLEIDINYLKKAVGAAIQRLYAQGVKTFICGGALGFDTLCAGMVIEFKKIYPDIKLKLILPCRDQNKYWKLPQRKEYDSILANADETEYITTKYTRWCMLERNRKMVEESGYLISYCKKNSGGSYYTLKYAYKLQRKVTNIVGFYDLE